MKLVYDPDEGTSYGSYYCPECKAHFYAGGRAMHRDECSQPNDLWAGYENTEHRFGPAQVAAVIAAAREDGPDYPWYSICLNDLRREFPELLSGEKGEA